MIIGKQPSRKKTKLRLPQEEVLVDVPATLSHVVTHHKKKRICLNIRPTKVLLLRLPEEELLVDITAPLALPPQDDAVVAEKTDVERQKRRPKSVVLWGRHPAPG